MSIEDFDRCTPSEFYHAAHCRHLIDERNSKDAWERTRQMIYRIIAPFCNSQNLKATDVMRFAWDEESEERRMRSEELKKRTPEEERNHWEEVMKRRGLK